MKIILIFTGFCVVFWTFLRFTQTQSTQKKRDCWIFCISVFIFHILGIVYSPTPWIDHFALLGLSSTLVALGLIDIHTYTLPNALLMALALFSLILQNQCDLFLTFYDIFTLFTLCSVLKLYFFYAHQRDALGIGDIKLLSLAGFWVTWTEIPFFFTGIGCVGSLWGLWWTYKKKSKIFPFGPIISLFLYFWVIYKIKK